MSDFNLAHSLTYPDPTAIPVIPIPVQVESSQGRYEITRDTVLWTQDEGREVAGFLAQGLREITGFDFPILTCANPDEQKGITLKIDERIPCGKEGYDLEISPEKGRLTAQTPAGLFYAAQTLLQMLPVTIDSSSIQAESWMLPGVVIHDKPRFHWRGMMLDVARHFFKPEVIKRLIDQLAMYKINTLHLHLSDDQGWRLMIESWPALAEIGGSTAVGETVGGYYTQAEYKEIAAYAASRYITFVPEIDIPGHTNAALASYPELNPDGQAREGYTGTEVGFSTLDANLETTGQFLRDVFSELAHLTPGDYLHIGGDESNVTQPEDYRQIIQEAVSIVHNLGKKVVGWEEIVQVDTPIEIIAQVWRGEHAKNAVEKGVKLVLSPAYTCYLDMKYSEDSPLGLDWAGNIETKTAYLWDPAHEIDGVNESDICGIEAALWTETVTTAEGIDYLTFPRLPALAEVAWSQENRRDWVHFRARLAAQAPRWRSQRIHFYPSPQVNWVEG